MKIRATGIIAWLAMALLAAILVPPIWNSLRARKSVWLLYQGRLAESYARLPISGPEGQLLDAVLTGHHRGLFESEVRKLPSDGTGNWWRAVFSHEDGRETVTRALLIEVAANRVSSLWNQASGLELSPERQLLSQAFTQTDVRPLERISELLDLTSRLTPLERRFVFAKLGTMLYEDGNWSRASNLLTQACEQGSRSPVVHSRTVAALALDGQYGEARRWADKLGPKSPDVIIAAAEVAKNWEVETAESSLSPVFDLTKRRRSAAVARAVDWLETQKFLENPRPELLPRTTPQLLGQDPIRLWFAAERLESLGRVQEAFAVYNRLQELRPTLAGSFRMSLLQAAPSLPGEINPVSFVAATEKAIYAAAASQLTQWGFKTMHSQPAVLVEGSGRLEVESSSEGLHQFVLLAAGNRANGQAPIVTIRVDGNPAASICIASDEYDAYHSTVNLPRKSVTIELEFANPQNQPDSSGSLRSIRLSHLMITRQDTGIER